MREPLRIFLGYDSRESVAWHVAAHSILARASCPVAIIPLVQSALREAGAYTRERGPTESTEFSLSRFLVPYLSQFYGTSIFMDCDVLLRADICELWGEMWRAEFEAAKALRDPPAVLCVQHDYTPTESVKFEGNVQTVYPRKNWSSVMVFKNDRCRALTPDYINTATGLQLHRFQWLEDAEIGALSPAWNHLVGDEPPNPTAKLVHFTNGIPIFAGYEHCEFADEWRAERDAAFGQRVPEAV
jgi:hypothetical protein